MTEIQARTIPALLTGRDIMAQVCAPLPTVCVRAAIICDLRVARHLLRRQKLEGARH